MKVEQIAHLRREYALASLSESDIEDDPFVQFQKWFSEAVSAAIDDVNAMTLATIDASNKPHARIVLLKGFEQQAFVFFTNYHSHKGNEIAANAQVSLLFHWKELQRQIRIEGVASRISETESETYFQSRPLESQLGAWASQQSEVLESREVLEQRFREISTKYAGSHIPKPPHWGGYQVKPFLIEFWQGRENRLHDRFCFYLQHDNSWKRHRLNP